MRASLLCHRYRFFRQPTIRTVVAGFVVLILASGLVADDADNEFFEKQVRPILVARCLECHGGQTGKNKGGLRLDSRSSALKGGDTGPAVVPGKLKESLLIDAINYGELYQMPPKGRLPAEEVATLTKWVEQGAPWPGVQESGVRGQESVGAFDLAKRKAEHWCWQPIKDFAQPAVKDQAWPRDAIDRFILSKLEEKQIRPTAEADARTVIRRVYFDLIGLPPSPTEVERFVAGVDSYEAVVDRLLASPRFGERWARHWLDLVRYAESRGHEFDYTIPNAFEYRDYVIRALNADVPYDQFVTEHIAGDLLPQPRLNVAEGFNESIIGTGFWFLGEWCHSPVDIRKDECDRIDNMLDVFSKTFLGVTVACARCHDHKFDAISQRDYYSLAGYLQSSSYRLTRFGQANNDQRIAAELAELEAKYRPKIAAEVTKTLRGKAGELAKKLATTWEHNKDNLGVLELDLRGARTIVDYANLADGQWMADGPTFGAAPVQAGQLLLTGDTESPLEIATYSAARRDWTWPEFKPADGGDNDPGRLNGWMRAGRTLKTPTFTLQSGVVHYLIEGVGHVYAAVDSHAMINGPLHAELLKETGGTSDLPMRWITHDLSRYAGHRVHLEFSPKEDEDFRLLMVVEGSERPAPPQNRPNRLMEGTLAAGGNEAAASPLRELISSTLKGLSAGRITDDALPLDRAVVANWLITQSGLLDLNSGDLPFLLKQFAADREALLKAIRSKSRLCIAMWDGTPVDEHLLIRGNHKTVGALAPRGMPEAIQGSGSKYQEAGGSGRLDLAKGLVDQSNPLVSRVIVNRVWQHLMGRGIVPSVDNFGVLGQPPTHPELLDYLASEFVRDGWSIKRLARRIVLSSTYRQGSEIRSQESGDRGQQVDPQNLLFHRQNLKRLEGEAIRDAMLAVSGRLDTAMYGPSVPVYLTPFMQGRGRPKDSGPLEGNGRRSIYTAVRRNFLSPMMVAFDTPAPFTTIGRRNSSNVPAQALILMNDPFVAEQASHWADKTFASELHSAEDRIRGMYRAAFCREPSAPEIDSAIGFLRQQAHEYKVVTDKVLIDSRAWADLAHVLLNVKEFVLVN
jgi:hypothetical protein